MYFQMHLYNLYIILHTSDYRCFPLFLQMYPGRCAVKWKGAIRR